MAQRHATQAMLTRAEDPAHTASCDCVAAPITSRRQIGYFIIIWQLYTPGGEAGIAELLAAARLVIPLRAVLDEDSMQGDFTWR